MTGAYYIHTNGHMSGLNKQLPHVQLWINFILELNGIIQEVIGFIKLIVNFLTCNLELVNNTLQVRQLLLLSKASISCNLEIKYLIIWSRS